MSGAPVAVSADMVDPAAGAPAAVTGTATGEVGADSTAGAAAPPWSFTQVLSQQTAATGAPSRPGGPPERGDTNTVPGKSGDHPGTRRHGDPGDHATAPSLTMGGPHAAPTRGQLSAVPATAAVAASDPIPSDPTPSGTDPSGTDPSETSRVGTVVVGAGALDRADRPSGSTAPPNQETAPVSATIDLLTSAASTEVTTDRLGRAGGPAAVDHPGGTDLSSVAGADTARPSPPDPATVDSASPRANPGSPAVTVTSVPSHAAEGEIVLSHAAASGLVAGPAPVGGPSGAGGLTASLPTAQGSTLDVDGLSGSITRPLANGDGTYAVTVAMHPPELGHVQAVVALEGNDLQVSITPQTGIGHDALRASVDALKQQLARGGLQVNITLRDPSSQSGGDGRYQANSGRTATPLAVPVPADPSVLPVLTTGGQIHLVL